MCNGLITTSIPCLLALLERKEVEPGKEGDWRKGVFKIYFTFHYPTSILLVISSMNIPSLSLFCLWSYLSNELSVLILAHEPSVIFCLSSPVAEPSDWEILVGVWCPARVNPLLKNTCHVSVSIVLITISMLFLRQNVPLPYYKSHPPVTPSYSKWNVQTPRIWDRGAERFPFQVNCVWGEKKSLVNILCSS